jgi:hypothetical protein
MKKIVTLAAALMIFGASASMAQGGLNLYWNGCSDGGASAQTYACNSNSGAAFTMYASMILPADMPQFAATSAIIDITFSGATIPAWWQVLTGQCSANRVSESYDSANFTTNCSDIWQSAANLSVFQVQPAVAGHGPNTMRLNGGAAVPAGSELAQVADGTEMVVCKVSIGRTKTVGTGSCAGCNIGACFTLNECKAQQPAGVGDYTVTNPAASNFATWQVGGPSCPGATPAQNKTWGAVKNLYR